MAHLVYDIICLHVSLPIVWIQVVVNFRFVMSEHPSYSFNAYDGRYVSSTNPARKTYKIDISVQTNLISQRFKSMQK